MQEIDISTITRRSIHGVFALVSRTLIVQIIGIVASFILTIFLEPDAFGVFFVVSAVIAFLTYFSDLGLAAALIQKKEKITDEDLRTTFTIQQVLVLSVVIIALSLSHLVGVFYQLQEPGILLFQALIVAFFLSSLKTIPSIILERDLRFDKLIIPQILETIVFYGVVVTLAIMDYGITSFTIAVLARGIVGLIAMYIIQPWKMRIGFSRPAAKKLLSFGIPFQTNSFLALLKDELILIYLGRVLPLSQVGYIGFAKKWALIPLRLIMDNVIRITFPSFSRLQHDKNALTIGIQKSLFAGTFVILPSLIGIVILSPYLIHLIPRYQKWEPALLSLSLFAVDATFSSLSTPLTNALNAIGKIRITLYLMVFWTIATWVLTPIAIMVFGFNGVAAVSALISTSVVAVVFIAKKYIQFNLLNTIKAPLFSSLAMGVLLYFASPYLASNIITLIIGIAFFGAVYLGFVFLLARSELTHDLSIILKQFKAA